MIGRGMPISHNRPPRSIETSMIIVMDRTEGAWPRFPPSQVIQRGPSPACALRAGNAVIQHRYSLLRVNFAVAARMAAGRRRS